MFQIESYMKSLITMLRMQFADRLLYVGLQGSYLRGEATEQSDLDVVVILDGLTAGDLAVYRAIVESLPDPEKACGFICGKQEMANWNPLEICNFLYGTKDYYGKIAGLLPAYTREDVINFIKLSAGNLYHELCHRYVHGDAEKNKRALAGTYKGVFFILQSMYYLKDGVFYLTKKELVEHLDAGDRTVMEMAVKLGKAKDYDFEEAFALLLSWCQRILAENSRICQI